MICYAKLLFHSIRDGSSPDIGRFALANHPCKQQFTAHTPSGDAAGNGCSFPSQSPTAGGKQQFTAHTPSGDTPPFRPKYPDIGGGHGPLNNNLSASYKQSPAHSDGGFPRLEDRGGKERLVSFRDGLLRGKIRCYPILREH